MPVTINGNGHISGLAVGGLPNGSVDADSIASNAVTSAKLHNDAVTASKLPSGTIIQTVTSLIGSSSTGGFGISSSDINNPTFLDSDCKISITPTYSGCPAIKTFEDDIKTSLIENKITNFKINKVYAPAWTTDWMSKKTKEKLKNYGISPPSNQVVCPQCNSINTNMISEFGATACKSMHKCLDCLEPFEHFKCI